LLTNLFRVATLTVTASGFVLGAGFCSQGVLAQSGTLAAHPQAHHVSQGAHPANTLNSTGFEPLDKWRTAVMEGNQQALVELYSTSPAAITEAPQGATRNPIEEPLYWAGLKGAGLRSFDPKILEIDQPKPGFTQLVLRIEGTIQTKKAGLQPFVVGASQVWERESGGERVVYTKRSDLAVNVARTLPEPAKPNIHLYPPANEAQADINTALAAASRDHKHVLLVFGGNWCYDCHVLDTTFRSREIAPLVDANFHVVHVNIGDYDQNLDLATKYSVPLKKGVPCIAVLDASGKLLYSQENGDFEDTLKIGPRDVIAFLNRWKPHPGAG
jgi:thioredoxin 1